MIPASFLCAVLATLAARTASALSDDELSYTTLKASNVSGQYTLSAALGLRAADQWYPLTCSNGNYSSCPNQPVAKVGDGYILQAFYKLTKPKGPNGTVNTYLGGQPTLLKLKMCFSTVASTDRAWRGKNKAYPRLSQNCPHLIGSSPWDDQTSLQGTFSLSIDDTEDDVSTATWFLKLDIYCGDTVCAFDNTEGKIFFETEAHMGITTSMKIATAVMSAFGPLFFIGFWFFDTWYYNKHGKCVMLY